MKCETNFKDGVKKISETKRPGMVIIHKSTCTACNELRPKLLASKEIDRLSNFFVVISLMDDKKPADDKLKFDGNYYPRIFFLDLSGQIMKEIKSPEQNEKFKYYYSTEKSLIQSMEMVLKVYPYASSSPQKYHERIMKCDFDLHQGLNRMRASYQPGMVIIYKTWCPVCSELKAVLSSSREINYLSNYIVIVLLKDENEPQDAAYAPDGSYIPRIFFLAPTGNILYDVVNNKADPRYKYFYTKEKELIFNMRRVINFFPANQK